MKPDALRSALSSSFFSCSEPVMALMLTLQCLRSRASSTFVMENTAGMRGSFT